LARGFVAARRTPALVALNPTRRGFDAEVAEERRQVAEEYHLAFATCHESGTALLSGYFVLFPHM
jgi:hypothetical protein